MPRTYLDTEAPIAALATGANEAALAVIRAFGPGSIELAASCFSRPEALRSAAGHALVWGELLDPRTGESVDEILAAVFRAPRSPTGEDGVELSCHGSPAVVRRAIESLAAAGFAPALPGEFTFRAFLSGRIDLIEAEAVRELSSARSEGERAEALRRLEGGLSRRLAAARSSLVAALAETEARLDHGEEDGAPESPLDRAALRGARDQLSALAASFAAGRMFEKGARVVLAGRPNAGKSSLFNLILREERAIVSPEPGTTRDWIEASVELGGLPVRLVDTAGLREASSSVEAAGVARSRALADEAQAVAYLVDGSSGIAAEDEAFLASRPDALRVWSKSDDPACAPAPEGFLPLSAATGAGFPAFAEALLRLVSPSFGRREGRGLAADTSAGDAVVASPRQKALLDAAVSALDAALEAEARGAPLDAIALDLRDAADALGEMTGEIAGPEVLEAIFSRFCFGK